MEYEDRKRMIQNHEEGSELEWICVVWVPYSLSERERENRTQVQNKKDKKNISLKMYEHMMCKN